MLPIGFASSAERLLIGDLLYDATLEPPFPLGVPLVRLDHHEDGGWTMLDSLAKADWDEVFSKDISRLCTSYLDPDAIVAGAYLRYLFRTHDISVLAPENRMLQHMYSASYWSDHGVPFPNLAPCINAVGEKIELWLRKKYGRLLGFEDRQDKSPEADLKRANVLTKMVDLVEPLLIEQELPNDVLELNPKVEIEAQTEYFRQFVRREFENNQVGVLDVRTSKRKGTPRAYYPLFDQPLVLRRIARDKDMENHAQYILGVNMLVRGWEQINLVEIAERIQNSNSDWHPTGRRGIIGASSPLDIFEIIELLAVFDVDDYRDDFVPWAAYSWPKQK